jgi:acetolactate decarboxylase
VKVPRILALIVVAILIFLAGFIAGWTVLAPPTVGDTDLLYQVSTYTSLAEGAYDGMVPVGELMRHGDLGLGTFEGLDGEMVVLDGKCFQVKADGSVSRPGPSVMVPFAAVTRFEPDLVIGNITAGNLTELGATLDARLPSRSIFWAVRMEGTFPYVKARSVPAQGEPYPPLADALKNQSVFIYRNVSGTVVGFFTPDSAAGIDSPGFHLHFLAADRTRGGHVLDIVTSGGRVELDTTPRLTVTFRAGAGRAPRGEH